MSAYGLMLRYKRFLVISLALLLGLLLPIFVLGKPATGAGTFPTGFTQTRFVGGVLGPTAMAFAPDGRLFVAEQRGTLRVVKNGQLLETPFLDISSKVSSVGERGLLGVAFDPNFATNNCVYVYYTQKEVGTTPAYNLVARFTANGDTAVPGSEATIFQLPYLGATNHNGGAIHFGKDGKLYVAAGENARSELAQSLGKMLRINPDGSIPEDNPFYNTTTGANRAIWALGLRNPFSFDVQPGTGRIFINDVGQQTWEEINEGQVGANYGWPLYEGPVSYVPPNPNVPPNPKKRHHKKHRHVRGSYQRSYYTGPLLYAYTHASGCAITGGAFYNPGTPQFPEEYVGDYFFADFCAGWINKFDPGTGQVTAFKSASDELPVDLKVSEEGDLYFLARATGSVEKIS